MQTYYLHHEYAQSTIYVHSHNIARDKHSYLFLEQTFIFNATKAKLSLSQRATHIKYHKNTNKYAC